MPDDRNEDVVYAEFLQTSDPQLEAELYGLLRSHATRLVWIELKEAQAEVVDESVERAMRNLRRFKGTSKFSTWFTRIVINTTRSFLKKKMRRREVPLNNTESANENESALHAKLLVHQMIASLPPDEQEFVQWKLQGETEQDIAARTGLTPEGVRSRWHRLKRKLR